MMVRDVHAESLRREYLPSSSIACPVFFVTLLNSIYGTKEVLSPLENKLLWQDFTFATDGFLT